MQPKSMNLLNHQTMNPQRLLLLFIFMLVQVNALYAKGEAEVAVKDTLQANVSDTVKKKSNWKCTGVTSLNMTQSSYSNWAAGGENSIAGVAAAAFELKHAAGKLSWDNALAAAYGTSFQESDRRKLDDRFEFATKLGYKASKYWSYTALLQMKTQFDKGYTKYPIQNKSQYISNFFAPCYVTASIGMDYKPRPNLSVYISPVSVRNTIVSDDSLSHAGAFGVKPDRWIRSEYGAFVKVTYEKKIAEKSMLKSKLELFSNLEYNPQNVDVNLEVSVDFKVTKWLTTSFYAQMVYDDDIHVSPDKGPSLQVKEVMGMGLSYVF